MTLILLIGSRKSWIMISEFLPSGAVVPGKKKLDSLHASSRKKMMQRISPKDLELDVLGDHASSDLMFPSYCYRLVYSCVSNAYPLS